MEIKHATTIRQSLKKNLTILFFARLCSSMGFSIIFSSLALYLHHYLHFSEQFASDVTGLTLALNYVFPLLGGFIGNRFIDFKKLYVIGMLMQAVGYVILGLGVKAYLVFGLASIIFASMVSSLGIIVFVNAVSTVDESLRRPAMLWNYAGMNLGFLIGFFISGYFGLRGMYGVLFLLVAVFPVIASSLVGFFFNQSTTDDVVDNRMAFYILPFIYFSVVSLIGLSIKYIAISRFLLMMASLLIVISIIVAAYFKRAANRKKVILFVVFLLVSIFFWSVYMLTPTALMQIIKDNVDLHVFHLTLAPQWLDLVESIIIVIFTPLLAKVLKQFSARYKKEVRSYLLFVIGLCCLLLGLMVFSNNMLTTHHLVNKIPVLVVLAYLSLLSFGEVFIGPEGYTLPDKLMPAGLKKLATGAWVSTLGVASLISSVLDDQVVNAHHQFSIALVKLLLNKLTISALIVILLLLFIGYKIEKSS